MRRHHLITVACRTRATSREDPSTGHKMRWPVVQDTGGGSVDTIEKPTLTVAQAPRTCRIRRQATKCDGLSYVAVQLEVEAGVDLDLSRIAGCGHSSIRPASHHRRHR